MLFVSQCEVMHLGYSNDEHEYSLGSCKVDKLQEKKDPGIIIDKSFKGTKQCIKAYISANAPLGMIRRLFINRDQETVLQVYTNYCRTKVRILCTGMETIYI